MQTPSSFRPIMTDGVVVRGKRFLQTLGQVLKLEWLKSKDLEVRSFLFERIVPNIACRAVENNDLISLRVLLQKMDASHETYDKFTALHTACELGNLEMIKFLLSMGASPHCLNRFGNCPMYMAIKNRHCHVVKFLHVLQVTVKLHPVRIAMEVIHIGGIGDPLPILTFERLFLYPIMLPIDLIISKLVLQVFLIYKCPNFFGIRAVNNKDYRLLYAWFLSGIDMDTQDYNGRTAMHEAVYLRDKLMISTLLEYGATPLERDVWGQTAMDNAQNDITIMALFEPLFTVCCPTKQAYLGFKEKYSHAK